MKTKSDNEELGPGFDVEPFGPEAQKTTVSGHVVVHWEIPVNELNIADASRGIDPSEAIDVTSQIVRALRKLLGGVVRFEDEYGTFSDVDFSDDEYANPTAPTPETISAWSCLACDIHVEEAPRVSFAGDLGLLHGQFGGRAPPLVVELEAKRWAWVQDGKLWVTSGAGWVRAGESDVVPGFGGRVLTSREREELVRQLGNPAEQNERETQ
jgi:hypothetical protein